MESRKLVHLLLVLSTTGEELEKVLADFIKKKKKRENFCPRFEDFILRVIRLLQVREKINLRDNYVQKSGNWGLAVSVMVCKI